jgi:Ca2+-binding RTX toxin-like protein
MYWLTWRSSSPRACLSQGARCPPTGSNTGGRYSISRFGSFTESLPLVAQPFEGRNTWTGTAGSGVDGSSVHGGAGDDILRGGKGDQLLRADDGDDRAYGGDGNDELYGGPGRDTLSGGPGRNVVRQD